MLTTLATRISRRPRRSFLITLACVIVCGVIGGPLAGALKSSGGFAPANSDSQVAIRQLERATGAEPTPGVVLLVKTPSGAHASEGRIATVRHRLAEVPGVLRTAGPVAVARGGHSVLVTGTIRASADDHEVAQATLSAFSADRDVVVGGQEVANEQISKTVTDDLARAELIALPLLVVLSLLFFRGRAALMPLAVGIATVLGTFLVLTGINHVYGLSVFALNLVIGLGLGLAVDYTLFLVTRYREELAREGATPHAIAVTMARAGRTVVFSAVTVACALATLIVFPQGFLKSMGIAGATVALVAALAALTITPALLALWGAKLRRGTGESGVEDQSGRWYGFARAVMRHPGMVALVTAAVMLAAALPALGTVWTPATGSSVIPKGESSRTVADAITRDFGGAGKSPVTVAISAPGSDQQAMTTFAKRVETIPGVTGITAVRFLGESTWQLSAAVTGDSTGPGAQRVVQELRALPAPFATKVAGDAATFVDQQAAISSHLPLAIGLLVILTFVVLWLMTDSVVLPLKAIVMNSLTVGAALAPLVLIYQHGNLTGLLGYTPNGGVEPTDFVVAATVVFALSTDYGVFLLGRIKEARDTSPVRPPDERAAVATGLGVTGSVVTAAAILLAVAIGAFSTSSISFIQQIGVATATGVLLDAFVVRSLLVPSLMALLGWANWWSPSWLRRIRAHIVPAEPRLAARRPAPIAGAPETA